MKKLIAMALIIYSSLSCSAELVYSPTNPTFGGNPLNGSFLLGKAQSQNDHKDTETISALDRFRDTVERNVLSNLAREFSNLAFGEGDFSEQELVEGAQYSYGPYIIQVLSLNVDTIELSITNKETGDSTTIEIPIF